MCKGLYCLLVFVLIYKLEKQMSLLPLCLLMQPSLEREHEAHYVCYI